MEKIFENYLKPADAETAQKVANSKAFAEKVKHETEWTIAQCDTATKHYNAFLAAFLNAGFIDGVTFECEIGSYEYKTYITCREEDGNILSGHFSRKSISYSFNILMEEYDRVEVQVVNTKYQVFPEFDSRGNVKVEAYWAFRDNRLRTPKTVLSKLRENNESARSSLYYAKKRQAELNKMQGALAFAFANNERVEVVNDDSQISININVGHDKPLRVWLSRNITNGEPKIIHIETSAFEGITGFTPITNFVNQLASAL